MQDRNQIEKKTDRKGQQKIKMEEGTLNSNKPQLIEREICWKFKPIQSNKTAQIKVTFQY